MSKPKHTPGPWKMGKYHQHTPSIYAEDRVIATVAGVSNGGRWPNGDTVGPRMHAEGKANQRLIAMAPELLKLLKALVAEIEVNYVHDEDSFAAEGPTIKAVRKMIKQADAAIAKAEGQQEDSGSLAMTLMTKGEE
jgi:hypothetical protein